jgi:hypothetical protein
MDALADFAICLGCLAEYGSRSRDPMDWLQAYLEEDAKLVSRKEALAILCRAATQREWDR